MQMLIGSCGCSQHLDQSWTSRGEASDQIQNSHRGRKEKARKEKYKYNYKLGVVNLHIKPDRVRRIANLDQAQASN